MKDIKKENMSLEGVSKYISHCSYKKKSYCKPFEDGLLFHLCVSMSQYLAHNKEGAKILFM